MGGHRNMHFPNMHTYGFIRTRLKDYVIMAPRGDSTEPRKPVSGRRGEDCGLTALAVCRHDSAGWQSRKGGRSWQLPFASASWYFPFAWCLRAESCGVGVGFGFGLEFGLGFGFGFGLGLGSGIG